MQRVVGLQTPPTVGIDLVMLLRNQVQLPSWLCPFCNCEKNEEQRKEQCAEDKERNQSVTVRLYVSLSKLFKNEDHRG